MRRLAPRKLLGAVLTVCVLLTAGAAHATNLDSFYLSSDAALQGGAITADARGGGASWYNPAGLAHLPGLRFDVSVNAYSVRFGATPDVDAVKPGTEVTRLTTLDFLVVPSGLTLTKRFGKVGVGFGIFVPNQSTTFLRTHVVQPTDGNIPGVDFGVDVYDRLQEYFAGPSMGIALGKNVDFGASLFLHYRTQLSIAAADLALPELGISTLSHSTVDWQQIGAQLVLGVQVHPTNDWHIGTAFRLPSLRLYEIQQTVDLQVNVSPNPGESSRTSEFNDDTGIATSIVSPARFHLGVSHDFSATRIAAEVNYQAPFHNDEIGVNYRPVVNGRLGGRHQLSHTLSVGGGIFTNHSAERTPEEFGDTQLDFYGITAALGMGTPYTVVKRGGETVDPPGELLFGTTVAFTYALGVGKVVQARIGGDPSQADFYAEVPTDVVAHEFVLHVGSSLVE